jgi:hypothetical protein
MGQVETAELRVLRRREARDVGTGRVTEMSLTRREVPERPSRRRNGTWLVVGAAAGLVAWLAVRAPHRASEPPVALKSARPPPMMTPSSALPAPATVTLSVETQPSGAELFVDGVRRGVTPVELVLSQSSLPHELALRLGGYDDRIERIVPDVTQRLVLPLERAVPTTTRRIEPAAAPTAVATSGPRGGFRRYD